MLEANDDHGDRVSCCIVWATCYRIRADDELPYREMTRYTPYDAMVDGSAVCQGIATLTYRMMTTAGIPTKLVEGTAGGGKHLWNEVEVGGHWYQLDVTRDDPVNKQPGQVSYQYYNLTNAEMAKDHSWSHAGLPAANTNFNQVLQQLLPNTY